MSLVIYKNGEPTPHRPFTDEENAPLDELRATARQLVKEDPEKWESQFRGLHETPMRVFLLEPPERGDNIEFSDLPEGIDSLWVRFKWKESNYNMTLDLEKDRKLQSL